LNAVAGAVLTPPVAPTHRYRQPALWLGLGLTAALAVVGLELAQRPWAQHAGLSALTLSILLGIFIGNSCFPAIAARTAAGVDLSKRTLLQAGIVLYGFRITFQQIGLVGWSGVVIAATMLSLTFLLAVQIGTRLFKLDRQTCILIGAGHAICGAAAVIATEPIVGGQAHKVSLAVATVVIFGTLSMFAYPYMYPHLGLSPQAYGVFAGSTIHEVAQVVVAGRSVSSAAADTAVIEKMLRVMMLAPFLLLLSGTQRTAGSSASGRPRITIPWFAMLFIVASGVNSMHWLGAGLVNGLIQVDTILLAMAMAALGLRTHVGAIRQAGARPLMLASVLFVFLTVGGFELNRLVTSLLS
jgi:uncharacterized integral membrane protein (TIGR00698 family)